MNNVTPTVVMPTRIIANSSRIIDHIYYTNGGKSDTRDILTAGNCSIPFSPFQFSCPTKSAVQSKKRHDISYRLNDYKILVHPLGFRRRPKTLRNHIPNNMYFPDRGCVRPLRHFYGYATAASLKRTRSGTSSQCSWSCSIWPRPRSNFRVPVITLAAAFNSRGNLSVTVLGEPARTVLQ